MIDKEPEMAHRICSKIQFQEGIDLSSLRVILYDNKTKQLYRDNDVIQKLSYLEYETTSLTTLSMPPPQMVPQSSQRSAASSQMQ